jgi:UDP-glucose 4-epimerase
MTQTSMTEAVLAGARVLVTGGNGFIGSHLIRRLVQEGAEVVALDVAARRQTETDLPWRLTFLEVNLGDAEAVAEVVEAFAPQILFHLASTSDARECFEQVKASVHGNLLLTVNVLEAFRRREGGLFIYGDSSKVYGNSDVPYSQSLSPNPLSSYAIAKSAGWDFCRYYARLYGISTVSVRPTLIYGPGQPFNLVSYVIGCVLANKELIRLDGGSQTRDLLYIDDAVSAYLAVARHGHRLGGNVINIGGGCEWSVADLARKIIRLMDSNVQVQADMARMRPTEMRRSYCDNTEAEQMLGWRPLTDLETGLKQTIAEAVALCSHPTEDVSANRETANGFVRHGRQSIAPERPSAIGARDEKDAYGGDTRA